MDSRVPSEAADLDQIHDELRFAELCKQLEHAPSLRDGMLDRVMTADYHDHFAVTAERFPVAGIHNRQCKVQPSAPRAFFLGRSPQSVVGRIRASGGDCWALVWTREAR